MKLRHPTYTFPQVLKHSDHQVLPSICLVLNTSEITANYDILKDLGEGTFGSVKLGKQ